jgi:hypothetical protein
MTPCSRRTRFLVEELAQARHTPNEAAAAKCFKFIVEGAPSKYFKIHRVYREIAVPQHMQIKCDWNIL